MKKWEDKDGNDDHGRQGGSQESRDRNAAMNAHDNAAYHERMSASHAGSAADAKDDKPLRDAHADAANAHSTAAANYRAAGSSYQGGNSKIGDAYRSSAETGGANADRMSSELGTTKKSHGGNMKNFEIFIPITKVDEKLRLVYGIATAEKVDKSGEIMDYDSTVPYYKEWSGEIHKASGGKSLGNVREMHGGHAAGKIVEMVFNDDEKQIEVCSKVVDDSSWNKVMEGVLTGYSHGGEYVKTWKDKDTGRTRYTAKPAELSLVDNPCLGEATFTMIRADGATEMRKFKTTQQKETPMLKTLDENGKPLTPKYVPVQKWAASDGRAFEKKEDWRAHELALEQGLAVADPAASALAELNKALDDHASKLAKKEYTDKEREEMADKGHALPDGSFPIADKADLENAVQAYGRAKDKAKAKAHIEARAEDLGLESELPEKWDDKSDAAEKYRALFGETVTKVEKFCEEAFDAATAIEALQLITQLICGEEWEAMIGEPEEGQVAMLAAAAAKLKEFIASEIMENEPAAADKVAKAGARHGKADMAHLKDAKDGLGKAEDGAEDAKDAHSKLSKIHDGMVKCLGEMGKCMGGDAEKFAKAAKEMADHVEDMSDHLAKADKQHDKLNKAHDAVDAGHSQVHHALKGLGADAAEAKDGGGEGDKDAAEKALASAELVKMKEENAALREAVEKSAAAQGELQKSLDQLAGQIPALTKRVQDLANQPLPAKGALYATDAGGKPVKKGHETDPVRSVEAPVMMNGLSPEQSRALMNNRR